MPPALTCYLLESFNNSVTYIYLIDAENKNLCMIQYINIMRIINVNGFVGGAWIILAYYKAMIVKWSGTGLRNKERDQ